MSEIFVHGIFSQTSRLVSFKEARGKFFGHASGSFESSVNDFYLLVFGSRIWGAVQVSESFLSGGIGYLVVCLCWRGVEVQYTINR